VSSLNIAVKPSSSRHENTLIWAVICSLALHALLLAIPKPEVDPVKLPEVLTVELMAAPEPPTIAPAEPTPPTPEPVKPKPTPKPVVKPLITPKAISNAPPPDQPPPSTPTEVIALAPKAETAPAPLPILAITPPEPVKPAAPSQTDMTAALNSYNSMLWGRIAKYKLYPKIAQMRGWQGEVIVELLLDGNGKLKSKKIISSSGYDVLDKQALEMIEKAAPFPAPPEALRSSSFSITVPIPFKLE
jgi:protein TonB